MNIKEEVKYSNDDMPASDNLEKFKEKFEKIKQDVGYGKHLKIKMVMGKYE